jgi:hypothetical protein
MNRSTQFSGAVRGFAMWVRTEATGGNMLQLIGVVVALIANLLFASLAVHVGGPFGVSGGGPVGRPIPFPAPTIIREPPSVSH